MCQLCSHRSTVVYQHSKREHFAVVGILGRQSHHGLVGLRGSSAEHHHFEVGWQQLPNIHSIRVGRALLMFQVVCFLAWASSVWQMCCFPIVSCHFADARRLRKVLPLFTFASYPCATGAMEFCSLPMNHVWEFPLGICPLGPVSRHAGLPCFCAAGAEEGQGRSNPIRPWKGFTVEPCWQSLDVCEAS